jgi:hypothetical protein
MSEFDELDVLVAIRDVGVDPLELDRLDQRVATAFSETPSAGHWRPHARHVGRLIVAVAVVVPVLIVFTAVALLSGSTRPVAPPTSSSAGANVSTGTRQVLLRTLGVLRRPPDAASRRLMSCVKSSPKPGSAAFRACRSSTTSGAFMPFFAAPRLGASSGVRLDTSLIRVLPVPGSGDSVALVPATAPVSPGSPRRAEGLDIFIAFHDGAASPGPTPTSVTELRTHGLAVSGSNATPSMRRVVGAVVVPDGVATVTLQPIRLISAPAPVDPRRFGTSTTSVHDNIAAYRFTVPYVHDPRQKSLVYAVTVVARATWRDRHGTVIAQTTTQLQLWLKVRGNNGPITATN